MRAWSLPLIILAMTTAARLGWPGPAKSENPHDQDLRLQDGSPRTLEIVVHDPPAGRTATKRPAIVFFFGGGWENGTIQVFQRQADHLARRAWSPPACRLWVKSRQGVNPDRCVEDAKSAVRWLRANAAKLASTPTGSSPPVARREGTSPLHGPGRKGWSGGGDRSVQARRPGLVQPSGAEKSKGFPASDEADRQRRGARKGHLADPSTSRKARHRPCCSSGPMTGYLVRARSS